MACLSRRFMVFLLVCLLLVGCQPSPPTSSKEAGTTAEIGLPESDPPVLSKAVADRIRPGMSQEEAVGILQDAAKDTPAVKSTLENVVTLSKLNNVRLDLTVSQGRRKLALAFRDAKLVEKKQEGLE
jgi:hypothetical protein